MEAVEACLDFKKDGFGCAIEIEEGDDLFPYSILEFAFSIIEKKPIIEDGSSALVLIQLWDGSQCALPVAGFRSALETLLGPKC